MLDLSAASTEQNKNTGLGERLTVRFPSTFFFLKSKRKQKAALLMGKVIQQSLQVQTLHTTNHRLDLNLVGKFQTFDF